MAWQQPRTPGNDQLDFYPASLRKAELMLTAALTAVLLFIVIGSPTWPRIQM